MTDHMYHIQGMTDLDKTRDYARHRSRWGLMTDGPGREPPIGDTHIVLHHHQKDNVCAGNKHEVYKNGALEVETEDGKISAPLVFGQSGG